MTCQRSTPSPLQSHQLSSRGQGDLMDVHIPHPPPASQPQAAWLVLRPAVGGLHPCIWVPLFWDYPEILKPMLPWLIWELELVFRAECWEASLVDNPPSASAAQVLQLHALTWKRPLLSRWAPPVPHHCLPHPDPACSLQDFPQPSSSRLRVKPAEMAARCKVVFHLCGVH